MSETVDAKKNRFDPKAVLKLLDGIEKLVAMKGKKVEVFDLTKKRPSDAELFARLIGPTGNLRAPTARVGTTLLVGFNETAYAEALSEPEA